MGIDTGYEYKRQPFNVSWKVFGRERNVTIPRNRIFKGSDKFFTIGSCFANELRTALELRGFDVYPKCSSDVLKDIFPKENQSCSAWTTYGDNKGWWDDRAHLQCYNTFSIRQEFEKALGEWTQAEDDYFVVPREDGAQYWDPYRRSVYARSPEELREIVKQHDKTLREGIEAADVIVVTLGLIEAFRRPETGLATCQYSRFFVKHVKFEVTTFERNYGNIRRVCDLVKARWPEKRIVVTTSPVALVQTFRDMDVVQANMASKSMLRTVADEITRDCDNALYYPSYEICMMNEGSFKDDLRHVTEKRVKSIMDAFIQTHVDLGEGNNDDTTRFYE